MLSTRAHFRAGLEHALHTRSPRGRSEGVQPAGRGSPPPPYRHHPGATPGTRARPDQHSRTRAPVGNPGRGDEATRAPKAHLCPHAGGESAGTRGLTPHPNFFVSFLRPRHPDSHPSAQGRPVAEGEPAGLAGRKAVRLDQPFAVRKDLAPSERPFLDRGTGRSCLGIPRRFIGGGIGGGIRSRGIRRWVQPEAFRDWSFQI